MQLAAKFMIVDDFEGAIVNMLSINAQVAIPSIPTIYASKGELCNLQNLQL